MDFDGLTVGRIVAVWVVITACVAENVCDEVEGVEFDAAIDIVEVVAIDVVVVQVDVAVVATIDICKKIGINIEHLRRIIKDV